MAINNEISKAFNKHAKEYEGAALVQQEIGTRLFARLQYLKIAPKRILDLGCGPGTFTPQLAALYPKARIFGLDLAHAMLSQAKKKQSMWRRRWSLVSADMQSMPFPNGLFDLVFANQVIHWGSSLALVLRELNRVMRSNGCLMFSTLGPDTFKELKAAWADIDTYAHTNDFVDMHDIGDCLMAECFLDPVMDMELLAVHYACVKKLVRSLQAQGVKNINPQRNHSLTGKIAWQQFEKNYTSMQTSDKKFPLTYEILYGHAWKGEQRKTTFGTEVMIPVSQLIKNN